MSFDDFANPKQKSRRFYQPTLGLSTRFWAPLETSFHQAGSVHQEFPRIIELRTYGVASFLHIICGWARAKTEPMLCLTNIHDKSHMIHELNH
jgi:hypothetical protein